MSGLRAVTPASEPEHPSWDGVWTVDDVAAYLNVSSSALYGSIRGGEWACEVVRVGRCLRFPGPLLARRFGVTP